MAAEMYEEVELASVNQRMDFYLSIERGKNNMSTRWCGSSFTGGSGSGSGIHRRIQPYKVRVMPQAKYSLSPPNAIPWQMRFSLIPGPTPPAHLGDPKNILI